MLTSGSRAPSTPSPIPACAALAALNAKAAVKAIVRAPLPSMDIYFLLRASKMLQPNLRETQAAR
jgi:hypothetical protein